MGLALIYIRMLVWLWTVKLIPWYLSYSELSMQYAALEICVLPNNTHDHILLNVCMS